MNTFLLLNGNQPKDISVLKDADFILCADGAYNWAKSVCIPDLIVGDMDSIAEVPKDIPTLIYSKDKDYTDGQLGLQHLLDKNPHTITILGARGGRVDHEFFCYFLLANKNEKTAVRIDADDFFVELVDGTIAKNIGKDKIVSLSPFMGSVHILYTKGLQYPLKDATIDSCDIAPISNVTTTDTFEIKISKGKALVFYSK